MGINKFKNILIISFIQWSVKKETLFRIFMHDKCEIILEVENNLFYFVHSARYFINNGRCEGASEMKPLFEIQEI